MIILKWFPDTRGLSLEDCARVFGDEGELFGGKVEDVSGSERGVVRGESEVVEDDRVSGGVVDEEGGAKEKV